MAFDEAPGTVGKILDPAGFFAPGGIFGGPAEGQTALWNAQKDMVMRQLTREQSLWPELMKLLSENSGLQGQALAAQTGALDSVYPGAMDQLNTGAISPEQQAFLDRTRDERIAGLKGAADELVGSSVADLAKRGVLSSSTAEGTFGNINKSLLPAIKEANADYWTKRLELPTTNAMNRFNLANGYGTAKSGALRLFSEGRMNPFRDLWSMAATGGMGQLKDQPTSKESQGRLLELAGGIGKAALA